MRLLGQSNESETLDNLLLTTNYYTPGVPYIARQSVKPTS
jgi:hypothetical protein